VSLVTYNGTNFDDHLGSASISTGTNVSISTGISSVGVTAPNLTNNVTGCWVFIAGVPSSGNHTVALQESGVTKASAVMNFADIKVGFNYVRFATPYTFATLTASAYTVRVTNSSNSGSLRIAASGLWFALTYDTARAAGATDDVWVGGFHDSGLTAKTLTISGTSNSWGSGKTGITNSTTSTMAGAITIGNGGTFKFDTSAPTTLNLKGSVFTTVGGTYDQSSPSDKSKVNTLIVESATLGEQGIISASSGVGGVFLMNGATYDIYSKYASGLGTAASPMITSIAWDADVNDEIVIGGGTDYLKNETKYIKTRNSSTSFVLCDTPGGAESALVNTHAVGSHMNNLTRNVIIKPLDTAKGMWSYHSSSVGASTFNYSRWEYADSTGGKGLNPLQTTGTATSTIDGLVIYNTSSGNRYILNIAQGYSTAATYTGITLYNTRGSNFNGQSGILFSASSNKTLNDCFFYNAPGGTVSCGFMGIAGSSTANTFNNCHAYGTNAMNASGYAIGIYSSSANTFNNCTINASRNIATAPAITTSAGTNNIFNNCSFGAIANNGTDIIPVTGTLNSALFNNCTFGSTSLITNYLNQLDTSLIAFQDMDSNTSKHRWYTNYGSWWSAGAGLTDTTVRTASSLSLVSKPENATTGSSWTFKIPANPTSNVGIFGYVYRNATFSSGTLKVELFLPGTLLTATPDDTYTFATTTGSWLPFNISAYYSGTDSRYATVRITGVTATAGAYFFVDDLYDAGTGNKVASLDLWDEGQPSQIMVQSDFSVVPAAVWGFSDANTQASTMGKRQIDAADSAELASIR